MRRNTTPRAVLFDFNGVLVEDEHWHWRAYRQILKPLGIRLTRRVYERRYLPLGDLTACRAMLTDAGLDGSGNGPRSAAALVAGKRRLFRRLCAERGVGVVPGAAQVVRTLSRDLPLAIVSGASRSEIVPALRRAGILGCFREIVAAEDVRQCKPSPEGYLAAIRSLGLGSGRAAVAVEDSPGGIAAARAAGLPVLGVGTTYRPDFLMRAGAYDVIRSLRRPAHVLKQLLEPRR